MRAGGREHDLLSGRSDLFWRGCHDGGCNRGFLDRGAFVSGRFFVLSQKTFCQGAYADQEHDAGPPPIEHGQEADAN